MLPNINLFHLTLLVALLFVGNWMTPTPSYRAHPFHRGGAGYHCSIVSSTYHYMSYFALRYLIWSSFQYLILTCNLFQHTCFSCLKSTFFILSYQLHCCWLDDPHPFPGPTHSTGGRGVDVMTMTMAGGVGGGPGTWNIYIYTWNPNDLYFWRSTPQNKAFSNQNKGQVGSRYIYICIYI